MAEMESEEMHREAYCTYWIMIDCILIVLLQGYTSMSQYMMINSEVTKNIYTLHFLQFDKLHKIELIEKRMSLKKPLPQHIQEELRNLDAESFGGSVPSDRKINS